MPRPKKSHTPTGTRSNAKRHIVNVSLLSNTYHALEKMAKDQRRPVAQMVRLVLEDATGTAPE